MVGQIKHFINEHTGKQKKSFIAFQMVSPCSPCPLKSFRRRHENFSNTRCILTTPSNIPAELESSFLFLFGIPFWISIGNFIFYFCLEFYFFKILFRILFLNFCWKFHLQSICVDLIPPRLSFVSPCLSYHVKIPKSSNIPILLLPEPLRIKSHCP